MGRQIIIAKLRCCSQMINIIVAVSKVKDSDTIAGIGLNNTIPWKSKSDMKRFREITRDHVVVMGRNTYNSLKSSTNPKPILKNRINIVLTSEILTSEILTSEIITSETITGTNRTHATDNYHPDIILVNNLQHVFIEYVNREIFIIGGSRVYKEAIELSRVLPDSVCTPSNLRLYLTIMNDYYECDTFIDCTITDNACTMYGHTFKCDRLDLCAVTDSDDGMCKFLTIA